MKPVHAVLSQWQADHQGVYHFTSWQPSELEKREETLCWDRRKSVSFLWLGKCAFIDSDLDRKDWVDFVSFIHLYVIFYSDFK